MIHVGQRERVRSGTLRSARRAKPVGAGSEPEKLAGLKQCCDIVKQ